MLSLSMRCTWFMSSLELNILEFVCWINPGQAIFYAIRFSHFNKLASITFIRVDYLTDFSRRSLFQPQQLLSFISMRSFVNILEENLPTNKLDIFGKGGLLLTSLPYYLLLALLGFAYTTIWTNAWIMMLIIYLLLPYLDELFTLDLVNPTEQQRKELQKADGFFKLCLYAIVAFDWFIFFQFLKYFQSFEFTPHSTFNLIALVFVFSNLNSIQFAVAHEIFHKQGLFSKLLGTIHMSKNLYMHFTYEHLYGHHRKVATPEDPASAGQGETFYQFLPKTFLGSYKSVYKMQKYEENKPFYLNYAVLSVAASIAFTIGVYCYFGTQATILFLVEALGSIIYLQAINYIEHYGLRRNKLPNGEYQKVTIRHSWNAPHRITNYILFKLQRHSDHHQNSLKPYQTLLSLDESPHLPSGYSLMIIMSFFPKTWFRIMDPIVEQYKKNGVGTIRNQVTTKALQQTREFIVKLGGSLATLWAVSLAI